MAEVIADNDPLRPIYSTAKPDDAILLHRGRLGIQQGNNTSEGDGTLELVWTSRPKIRFAIPSVTPVIIRTDDCILRFPQLGAEAPAQISDFRYTGGDQGEAVSVQGEPNEYVVVGNESLVHQVVFHVVNFWNYWSLRPENAPPEYDIGRVAFEGGGWRITLQCVPELEELRKSLRRDSGWGITHVGRAERVDGSPVSRKEAIELFDALHSFLSFARGMWAPPILYVGIDRSGTYAWQYWSVRQASPWKVVFNWFPQFEPQCLARGFSGFMQLWEPADSRDILRVAIHWYVEANLGSGGIEGAVMMCQNGLERLAYYILVCQRNILKEKDFQPGGLPAAERLRQLLREFMLPIDLNLPIFRVDDLKALAVAKGWSDAPCALVTLRNSIVHPDQKNTQRLQNYPIPARLDALTVCLWYFELVLLKWFGYTGKYVNRQNNRFLGQTEEVP